MSLILAAIGLLSGVAFAQNNISVNVNGVTYQCSGAMCAYSCDGSYVGQCEGRHVDTRGPGKYVLIIKNSDGSYGNCLAFVQEQTDFQGLSKCMSMKRQVCD